MKKTDIEKEFIKIQTEFGIIKKLIYIIIAALAGLLIKVFWDYIIQAPSVVGHVVKSIF